MPMDTSLVDIGDVAPDFTLPDSNRNPVTLSSFRGKKHVVLAFYVLAMTAGCKIELTTFRDHMREFEKADAAVFGISVDTFPSLRAFANSLNLNFPLLSDFPDNTVTKRYGTYNPATGLSRRVTYVVDKAGVVQAEIVSDEQMTRHAEEALQSVQKLHQP
jgi:peroxiredoxin